MDSLRIIFLVVVSVGLTAGQVQLQPSNPSLEKPVGAIVIVFCEYTGSGTVQPTWRDPNNNAISPAGQGSDDGISVTYPSLTKTKLEIASIKKADEGIYSCDAAGGGGARSVTITTYTSLQFTNAPLKQDFELYTDAKVMCEVTSDPLPSYEWKFGSLAIRPGPKYMIQEFEYLQVTNISSEDGGTYQCQATVLGGNFETGSRNIEVQVLVPAKITLAPEDFNGTLGRNAEFKCIATGNPNPTYTWQVNNQRITPGGRFTIDDLGEKLTITDLVKTDVGSYMCIASIAGLPTSRNAERSAFLNVFIPPVVQEGVEVVSQENLEAVMTCNTVSGDDSELIWRRFGEDMPLGPQPSAPDIEISEVQGGSVLELRFSSVKRSYNGSYECFAKNSGGEASSVSNLTVLFAPVVDPARTNYDGYTSWIGKAVTMTCFWLSNPVATYYWRIQRENGAVNLTEPKFTTTTSPGASSVTFTPTANSDFAIYQCIAWNTILGTVTSMSYNVELKSAGVPDAPSATVDGQSPTTITLRIQAPEYTGGLDLTGYNVTWIYELMGQDVLRYQVFDYEDDERKDDYDKYVIENLLSAKQYKIRVGAVNEFTMGDTTQEIETRTLATRKPYAPEITSSQQSDKEDQYLLEWEEPKDSGLKIDQYYIQYWEYDIEKPNDVVDEGAKSEPQPVGSDYRQYTITQLQKATDYRLELWASNSIGPGDRQPHTFVTAGKRNNPTTSVKTTSPTSATKTPFTVKSTKTPPGYNTVHPKEQTGSLDKGTIIGIVIAAFLIVLIVVDISCCIVNDCGMTMCLCVHCCGRQAPGTKSHEIEMGEGGDSSAPKGGKVGYAEIREDGDGSAPTEPPVEKDKLIGSETEQAPPIDEKTPMLSDQDVPAVEATPEADGDAKTEPAPAAEAPVAEPAPAEADPTPPEPEPVATETPATETPTEPPTESTPEQNTTDEAKGGSEDAAE